MQPVSIILRKNKRFACVYSKSCEKFIFRFYSARGLFPCVDTAIICIRILPEPDIAEDERILKRTMESKTSKTLNGRRNLGMTIENKLVTGSQWLSLTVTISLQSPTLIRTNISLLLGGCRREGRNFDQVILV